MKNERVLRCYVQIKGFQRPKSIITNTFCRGSKMCSRTDTPLHEHWSMQLSGRKIESPQLCFIYISHQSLKINSLFKFFQGRGKTKQRLGTNLILLFDHLIHEQFLLLVGRPTNLIFNHHNCKFTEIDGKKDHQKGKSYFLCLFAEQTNKKDNISISIYYELHKNETKQRNTRKKCLNQQQI